MRIYLCQILVAIIALIMIYQGIEKFLKVNGVKIPHKVGPRRPGDIAACWADPTKINKIIGWRAEKTMADALRDAWK